MTVVASIAARNYLPRARVLARSLAARHPSIELHLLLADEPEAGEHVDHEPLHVLPFDRLHLEDPRGFCFRYGLRQRAAALKPYLLRHLLDLGHERVLFLDPDMLVTGSLSTLFEAQARHAVVLTPHLLEPAQGPRAADREREILRAGQFNAGVVAVRETSQARDFLDWWQARVARDALDSVAEGLYYDQRWLDLAPGLFDRLHVLRDPGCNVAHWNIDERPLHWCDGQLFSGNRVCRLLHFSGYSPDLPQRLSIYADATTGASSPALPGLLRQYRQRLFDEGQDRAATCRSAWEQFANGQPITPEIRAIFALRDERYADPFDSGADSFLAWLTAATDGRQPALTNFWAHLPLVVPALRHRWPHHLDADRDDYAEWVRRQDDARAAAPGAPAAIRAPDRPAL